MTGYAHVFEPLRIGRLTAKNRIECAPAIPFLASEDLFVTRELIEWYRAIAKGGAGLVTIGETCIDYEDARVHGRANVLCLADNTSINGLSVLAETIQRYGALASIEINYEGLIAPTEMTTGQIEAIIERFAAAAARCRHAGMDMVMIHGGHGHLIGSFFSPVTNMRSDRYGGTFENRARFALEVLEAVREQTGNTMAIEYRISGDELVPGAPSLDETIEFARMIEDKIDLLHVSAGNITVQSTCPWMIQPTYLPRGTNVRYAERFKRELSIPVCAVGSLTMDMAEGIIAEGKTDMVAMIRSIIADPDCVSKARTGRQASIRPCVRCNRCVSETREFTKPTRCTVNPIAGKETEFKHVRPSAARKKVVVAGGGPAGMEAARTAAGRGHEVVLFEREDRLGGALTQASAPSFKADMKSYLEWAERETLQTPGLEVRLSTEATAEAVDAERPDVLIVAVGSSPIVPTLPGMDSGKVVWASDARGGKATIGDDVIVAGAGMVGCEAALDLAQQGKTVTLIDLLPFERIALDVNPISRTALLEMLRSLRVCIEPQTTLEAVTASGVTVSRGDGSRAEIACDSVVLALGVTPRLESVRLFEHLAEDVHIIGDCRRAGGNLRTAITDGFNAAVDI
jgi:2,4-dienoyl-CoA reductase-like NADH-dependent reductase (Old Yellow Enzyme family)/NADPH-dependent 2,4-dienoyl-CoA reductase/sulfur reductase-like enzyme